MMTTKTQTAPEFEQPPSCITDAPLQLDDVLFTPNDARRIDRATRDGVHVGDVLRDDERFWFARKFDHNGELSDWRPMRCVHEARAFLVSKVKR